MIADLPVEGSEVGSMVHIHNLPNGIRLDGVHTAMTPTGQQRGQGHLRNREGHSYVDWLRRRLVCGAKSPLEPKRQRNYIRLDHKGLNRTDLSRAYWSPYHTKIYQAIIFVAPSTNPPTLSACRSRVLCRDLLYYNRVLTQIEILSN